MDKRRDTPLGLTYPQIILCMGVLILSACSPQIQPPQLSPVARIEETPTANLLQQQTLIAAGFTPTPFPSATPWPIVTSTPEEPIADLSANGFNPLTGLEVEDPELLLQSPIMVKLANWPQELRPAAGLNQADVVFEYYIGHQMNHFVALYLGQDAESVGPLAPARIIDARLTEHYQGNLAYASADAIVENIFTEVLPDRTFARGFAPCPAICTIQSTSGENTFVDTQALRDHIQELELESFVPSLSSLVFDPQLTAWDEDAGQLSLLYADFSVMEWQYNASTEQYELWQDHVEADGNVTLTQSFDRNSNAPISFDNVIILFANYIEYNSSSYDLDFRESDPTQRALVLRDGKLSYGTWLAPDTTSAIVLYDLEGAPLALKPGRSWITFASINTTTQQVSDGIWELEFSIK